MRLFSYCLRYDVGAAPSPYWGLCTLTICKPAIRRAAQVGDWVVGLGSANLPENRSNQVVFTMKVTYKKTMAEYDQFCQAHLPGKIPQWQSRDYARRVGDCTAAEEENSHDCRQGNEPQRECARQDPRINLLHGRTFRNRSGNRESHRIMRSDGLTTPHLGGIQTAKRRGGCFSPRSGVFAESTVCHRRGNGLPLGVAGGGQGSAEYLDLGDEKWSNGRRSATSPQDRRTVPREGVQAWRTVFIWQR